MEINRLVKTMGPEASCSLKATIRRSPVQENLALYINPPYPVEEETDYPLANLLNEQIDKLSAKIARATFFGDHIEADMWVETRTYLKAQKNRIVFNEIRGENLDKPHWNAQYME